MLGTMKGLWNNAAGNKREKKENPARDSSKGFDVFNFIIYRISSAKTFIGGIVRSDERTIILEEALKEGRVLES